MPDKDWKQFNFEKFEKQVLPKLDEMKRHSDQERARLIERLKILKAKYAWEVNRIREKVLEWGNWEELDKMLDEIPDN